MTDTEKTLPPEEIPIHMKPEWVAPAIEFLPIKETQNSGMSMPFDGAAPSPS